jgi:hypothetical protein
MTDLALGDTLRIPFLLYNSSGALVVDTTAGNYTWPLIKDGVAVSSPSFTITNPSGSGLELVYSPAAVGNYTFSSFTHSTGTPDLVEGGFLVRAYSVDDLMASLALPAAAPVGTVAEVGDKVRAFRNADWSQQFHLTNSDDTDRNLTGSTLLFRIGYRTSASDVKLYTSLALTPDVPATDGLVTVTLTDTETSTLPVSDQLWYELEETTAGGLKYVRGLGPFELIRDIPASP